MDGAKQSLPLRLWSWLTVAYGVTGVVAASISLLRGGELGPGFALLAVGLMELAVGVCALRASRLALLLGTAVYAFQSIILNTRATSPFAMLGLQIDMTLSFTWGALRMNLVALALAMWGIYLLVQRRGA